MEEKNYEHNSDDKLAETIEREFLSRQAERRALERCWQLNMNFVRGKQYCGLDAQGEIREEESAYFWQNTRVFNHIAPVLDTRLSKLSRIRPALTVRPASDSENDRKSAEAASAILSAVWEEADLDGILNSAAMWSEVCGTAFYKVMWDGRKGAVLGYTEKGKTIRHGGVRIAAVPPFEIYPYSLAIEDINEQPVIIHAKALPVEQIYEMYGVKLEGKDESEFTGAVYSENHVSGGDMSRLTDKNRGFEIVIERYERPSADFPDGRFSAVAGGKLLYDGILPYINGENGKRGYPFVKQTSVPIAGSFFGGSVVDRLIPVQRAYNAVKNRKHEFLNRIAMGVVAVEDGSVDADELAEDGLMPGKVLIYRQGGNPPEMLELGGVPDEFFKEEEKLLAEFSKISGTGNLSENADSFAGITSAAGLQLVLEQDDRRLDLTYNNLKRAVKTVARHILRLYRQFANEVRLMRYTGADKMPHTVCFKGSDISSDDVEVDADSGANLTPAQKRAVIYEMLDKGLFADSDGKVPVAVKNKILEQLGYGAFVSEKDLNELNREKAAAENNIMRTGSAEVKDYDGHAVHIAEHTAFLIEENIDNAAEKRICAHIAQHKKKLAEYGGRTQNYNKLSEAENG